MAKCYSSWWHKEYKQFIPCGKCEGCRKRMVSAWSVRLLWENKQSTSSHFITLTYDNQQMPISRNGYSTLRKRDVQLFFKRLRKAHSCVGSGAAKAIKYFCVGEYGGKIGRPHYHIILFNADIRKLHASWSSGKRIFNKVARKRWSYGTIRGSKGELYKLVKKEVRRSNGLIHYGDSEKGVCGASVGYCLKYILEPKDFSAAPMDYDAEKEFRVMSKGLGMSYLNAKNMRWHHESVDRMYMEIELGKKIGMPRYYKERIYNKEEKVLVKERATHRMVDRIFQDLVYLYKEDVIKAREDRLTKREAAYSRQRLLKIKNKKLVYA